MSATGIRSSAAIGAMLAALLLLLAPGQAGAAVFEEGVVEVNGYGWTTDPVPVQLNDISPTRDGATTYTVRDILENADGRSGQFNVDTVPSISIALPASVKSVKCSGDQMRAESAACPLFTSTADYTEMKFNGKTVRYKDYNPEIFISQAKGLTVALTPATKKIKSGDSVTFKATVSGANGQVTYNWNFGDGAAQQTSNGTIAHKFTGSDKQFVVVVTAESPGQRGDDALATITVGKVEKKPKKKPKKEKEEPEDTSSDYPSYTDDYYGYGSGTGTGTGSGTPSTGSPAPSTPEPKEQPEPPVDDSGETVTGQLIDPTQIATVIPPSDESASGGTTEEAAPADGGSGGGGMPAGVKTALGIGALLGLGGLAEAGAFSGALRRFRLRP